MSRDLYAEITAKIVAALEQGVAPWVRPWRSLGADTLPLNASSSRPYRGVNVIFLGLEAQAYGYPLNRCAQTSGDLCGRHQGTAGLGFLPSVGEPHGS